MRFYGLLVGGLALLVGCYDGIDSTMMETDADPSGGTQGSDSDTGPSGSASASDTANDGTSGSDTSPGSNSDTNPSSTSDSDDASESSSASDPTDSSSDSESGSTSGPDSATESGDQTSDDDGGSTGGMSVSDCSAQEVELINLVNEYRGQNGLGPIPASPSLCIVGHTHAEDLEINAPHAVGDCNLHSWSNAGAWSPCCYTPDHAQAECMWMKPAELTAYQGYGYENAAGGGGNISPQQALDLWKNSPGHNAVILNEGTWSSLTWGALGAGIYQGYAVLWFGEEADPAG